MLNEEVKRYRELSGDNNPHTPINRIGGYLDGYEKAMEQKARWIPVSERLPEDGTEVFVYLFDRPSPYIAWIEDTHWYTDDFEVEREDEPIAWMPLPEPYRGEEAET